MVRTLAGYTIVAVVGIVAIKLVLGLLGLVFSLMSTVLWLAAIGFVFYLILKIVSPDTARRVRGSPGGVPGRPGAGPGHTPVAGPTTSDRGRDLRWCASCLVGVERLCGRDVCRGPQGHRRGAP